MLQVIKGYLHDNKAYLFVTSLEFDFTTVSLPNVIAARHFTA